jgi:putative flavoprotein involved in K+ transport
VEQGALKYVRSGRIKVVSQVDHFAPDKVILADGTRLQPDVVLLATGYRPCLQHLVGHLDVLRSDGHPRLSAHGECSAGGLWFIGFTPAIEGTLQGHAIEASRIASD